jgi:hypothetical protein
VIGLVQGVDVFRVRKGLVSELRDYLQDCMLICFFSHLPYRFIFF